jgi:hypothetical protein
VSNGDHLRRGGGRDGRARVGGASEIPRDDRDAAAAAFDIEQVRQRHGPRAAGGVRREQRDEPIRLVIRQRPEPGMPQQAERDHVDAEDERQRDDDGERKRAGAEQLTDGDANGERGGHPPRLPNRRVAVGPRERHASRWHPARGRPRRCGRRLGGRAVRRARPPGARHGTSRKR